MTEPREVAIPSGALVLLIGAAGAGKSTFAARAFPPGAVLSSDAFRAAIGRDEADQSVTRPAFAALHRALDRRLAARRATVVDATNVTPAARRALLRRAAAHDASVVAIVFDLPDDAVLRQNASRPGGRRVPEGAVRRHLASLAEADDATLRAEGCGTVIRLRSAEAAGALRVRFS